MAKKLTKEELEQDALLNSYSKIQEFYFEHKTVIISSAVAIILAIGLAIGYHYWQKSQNKEALRLMSDAQTYFRQGQFENALNGSEEDFTVGFVQIINEYGGTKAGNLARYYAAVSAYNLGNIEKALDYIAAYNPPEGILGVASVSFHGTLQMAAGNFEKAAELFIEAAEMDLNESTTPFNYLEAARAYREAGNTEAAVKYAELVLEKYSNSAQAAEAEKLLGLLQAGS